MALPILSVPMTGRWKGLWRRSRETDVDTMFAKEAKNIELRHNRVAKRQGTKRLHQWGTGPVYGLWAAKFRDGAAEVIGAAGTTFVKFLSGAAPIDPPTPLNQAFPSGTPARTAQAPVIFTQSDDIVFGCNGLDMDVAYDGRVLRRVGIVAPTIPPNLLLSSSIPGGPAGKLQKGTYSYRYTFVNSRTQQESEPSPATTIEVTADDLSVGVSPFPSNDPQVDRTRVYRSVVDGDGVWLFVDEGNVGASLQDTKSDRQLGTILEQFVNDPPPGPMKLLAVWPQAQRLLGVPANDPSALYWTDLLPGDPRVESWPLDNLVYVNRDDGDEIVAVIPLYDSVLIQKRRSTWQLNGIPPAVTVAPLQYAENRTGVGGLGQRAPIVLDNEVLLPAQDGAYHVGRRANDATFATRRVSNAIDDLWAEFETPDTRWAHGAFCRSRRQGFLWMVRPPAIYPDRCLVVQLDAGGEEEIDGWTWWDVGATCSCVVPTAKGDVVYVGREDGYLYQLHQGTSDNWVGAVGQQPDDGDAIEAIYETVPFAPASDVLVDARGRFLDVVVTGVAFQTLLTITPVADFVDQPFLILPVNTSGFTLDSTPAGGQVGAGQLDSTLLTDLTPQVLRCVFLSLGRYHGVRIAETSARTAWAVDSLIYRFQALPVRTRGPAAVQQVT